MSNKLALLFSLVLPALISVAQARASSDHRVWIETSTVDGRLIVQPQIEAGRDASADYELISVRVGRAGRSESRQAGSVRLKAGETRVLSNLTLSVSDDDKYILTLRIFENGQVVGQDSITYPE